MFEREVYVCAWMRACVRAYACVGGWVGKRERVCVRQMRCACECVCECVKVSVRVCVCGREKERERERVCVRV